MTAGGSATIYALSSPPGRGGVAVVRVSGDAAREALRRLTGMEGAVPARTARLCYLRDPHDGAPIDRAMVLWFPAPRSFTGEDLVEFHVHGGLAVVAGVLTALSRVPTARLAEPGEFSRRAFLNGKLDLTGAEAIADLVDAETEAQRRQALRQMDGALRAVYEEWRSRLLRALAQCEASIDFVDEDDVPDDLAAQAGVELGAIEEEMRRHLADGRRGERLRDGISVVLLGPPNVGKSSLLNQIAGRDAAIVSSRAGTTRDLIEVHVDLGGYPVVLVDTAGLRDSVDEVEQEGVRRARARAEQADIRLLIYDGSTAEGRPDFADLEEGVSLLVANKSDLVEAPIGDGLAVSAKTGAGIEALLDRLEGVVEERYGLGEAPVLTRARHREAVGEALAAIERSHAAPSPELAAEDLRLATRAIGRITGRVDVEDVLDVIFAEFCIGK
ncbi:MAG: tRNA uridine-5-carboxymethylaminomethyl(34) synthesis GTPase MnmE [Alphaproteobacteria bacterium]|nr:tRNA uridine-5-carboxymethylaminomethyl(34) synthesis GTPase MnmE [Alphaproteobacteria bacterium]